MVRVKKQGGPAHSTHSTHKPHTAVASPAASGTLSALSQEGQSRATLTRKAHTHMSAIAAVRSTPLQLLAPCPRPVKSLQGPSTPACHDGVAHSHKRPPARCLCRVLQGTRRAAAAAPCLSARKGHTYKPIKQGENGNVHPFLFNIPKRDACCTMLQVRSR